MEANTSMEEETAVNDPHAYEEHPYVVKIRLADLAIVLTN